jgi:hypothetical protein
MTQRSVMLGGRRDRMSAAGTRDDREAAQSNPVRTGARNHLAHGVDFHVT